MTHLKTMCSSFPCSDPYTRLSLYDPVNGEITSLQTKTIKKVSDRRHFHIVLFCLCDSFSLIFFICSFLPILLHIDSGPKVEWRILFQSKCLCLICAPTTTLECHSWKQQYKMCFVLFFYLNYYLNFFNPLSGEGPYGKFSRLIITYGDIINIIVGL